MGSHTFQPSIDTWITTEHAQTSRTTQEDPIALKINKETREKALLYYTKRDGLHLKNWEIKDDMEYCSYIDFKVDVVFFYDFSQFELPGGRMTILDANPSPRRKSVGLRGRALFMMASWILEGFLPDGWTIGYRV
jgi:hypothetical protein